MAKRPARPQPFTVQSFRLIGAPDATIYWNGDFFMKVESVEGAEALADILNQAAALSQRLDLLGSSHPNYPAEKIAYAVARAMGGMIEFKSFHPEPREAARD